MEKRDDRFVIICLFLFASFASQIDCTNQTHVNQQGQKERDRIEKLPGQPPVSFKQYGGYVTVDESAGRAFYYYFVETTSANASAPLVLWLNGGPSCSSLGGGGMQGLGPFRVHSDGKTLYTNPYAWNTVANLLMLETPAEVGFSYTNTPSDLDKANDEMTAADNYAFLVKWLERFPEYKNREFYIAGESYAGHYVPQLAQTILLHNNKTFINLQGLFIGNPSIDKAVLENDILDFYERYGLVSQEYMVEYKNKCVPDSKQNEKTGPDCGGMLMKITDDIELVDEYNIYAPFCLDKRLTIHPKSCVSVNKFDPCAKHYVEAYLNMKEVQKVMHAKSKEWMICNKRVQDGYTTTLSVVPVYQQLIDKDSIRIWVYSGDLDGVIPAKSTMATLKNMNVTVEKRLHSWYDGKEVGGHMEKYKGKLMFATVKGAGHQVPSHKTKTLLTLFTHFIFNTPLPHHSSTL